MAYRNDSTSRRSWQPRPASRAQINKLRVLTLSSAFTDKERTDFTLWANGTPTAKDAHGMIDRALARVKDPEHKRNASLANRIDSLTARIAYALDVDQADSPNGDFYGAVIVRHHKAA